MALCAFAGLRVGEGAGLQVGDIDFLRRTRTVSRQIQRQVGGFEVRAPKYGSERTVFLAPALASVFTEHVANYRPENDLTRWLFTGAGEEPPHQNTVTHRWMKTRQAAGLESLELNDCRHFYASGLIAHGADVVTVQRALGRAKATTTFNTYLAHRRGSHRQAAEAMLVETLNLAGSVRTTGTD